MLNNMGAMPVPPEVFEALKDLLTQGPKTPKSAEENIAILKCFLEHLGQASTELGNAERALFRATNAVHKTAYASPSDEIKEVMSSLIPNLCKQKSKVHFYTTSVAHIYQFMEEAKDKLELEIANKGGR